MKKLQQIKIQDISHPEYTYLMNRGGLIINKPNNEVEKLLQTEDWHKPTEEQILRYFVKYNALPWKVNIQVPMFLQRSQNQGYTKMIDQLEEGLHLRGVSFTETLNESTDSILIINSVWTGANTGQLASQKIEAKKLGIKLGMFTMFESTKWIQSHVDEMEHLDYLIVPSKWNKECLEKQGYSKPIYVCPLPNSDDYYYVERPLKRDTFTFLMYNAMDYRKGFPEYIEAFKAEFKPDENVKFILKTREHDSAVSNMTKQDPVFDHQMEWVIETMQPLKVLLLHQETDCFVFPSKGEGWGYPPLEALLSGNPVITTNAHSHKEWFNDACLEVETVMEDATYSIYGEKQEGTGKWFKPKVESLRRQMRFIYEQWKKEGREAKIFKNAEKQSKLIQEKFDKKAVTEQLLSIFKQEGILDYDQTNQTEKKRSRGRPRKSKTSK